MKTLRRNITVIGLAASMLCAIPLEVQAAPELTVSLKGAPNKTARTAYRDGKTKALAGDAEAAVASWATLLQNTPESLQTRRFRMQLIVDTIRVALDAHAQSPNPALLERTLDVYYAYFAAHEQAHGNPNIPGPVVEARFALKAAIDESTTASPDPESPPQPEAEPDPTPAEPPPPSAAPNDGVAFSTSDMRRGDGTGLIVAGGVTMAVGVGLTSLIAVGAINRKNTQRDLDNPDYSADQRSRIEEEKSKADAMFIAGLVAAPVAVVTGGVLLGIGAKRRADSNSRYATVRPALSRTRAGLVISGRF